MSETELQQALETLFPRIHRAALVLTGNPWDADDLAQQTFLIGSKQAGCFAGRSSLYSWLYGILLNLERHERRRSGLHRLKLNVLWADGNAADRAAPPAEAPIEAAEWKNSLWGAVARLPDGQRQALVLRYSEHQTYEEIAAAMDCPLGTVKSRIFNGLEALRKLVSSQAAELCRVPNHLGEDLSNAV